MGMSTDWVDPRCLSTDWATTIDRLSHNYRQLFNTCRQTVKHAVSIWHIHILSIALGLSMLLLLLSSTAVVHIVHFKLQISLLYPIWVWKLYFSSPPQFSTSVKISQIWAEHQRLLTFNSATSCAITAVYVPLAQGIKPHVAHPNELHRAHPTEIDFAART